MDAGMARNTSNWTSNLRLRLEAAVEERYEGIVGKGMVYDKKQRGRK